jgi:hypothetical protein
MDSQRISPITGLPVRKYTKKNKTESIINVQKPVDVFNNVVKKEKFVKFFNSTTGLDDYSFKISHKTFKNVNFTVNIIASPTGNCQLCSVRYFEQILINSSDIKKQLLEIGEIKKLILIDIYSSLKDKLKLSIDKNAIILEEDYISSNNSKMSILIINTKKL